MSTLVATGLLLLLLDALGAQPLGRGHVARGAMACVWAATVVIKAFTALLALPYARARRRLLVVAGMGLVALAAGSYFAGHTEDFRRYLAVNGAPFMATVYPGLMGFQGLVRSVVDHTLPATWRATTVTWGSLEVTAANLPSAALCGAALALALWGTWRLRRDQLFQGLSLWVLVLFLVYRQVWEYHYLMLLPVVACAYLASGARWTLAAWAMMALPTPYALLAALAGPAESSPWWILQHAAKPAAVLLAFAALVPWRRAAPAGAVQEGALAARAAHWTPAPALPSTPAPLSAPAVAPALAQSREAELEGAATLPD
jgi:hypothetical protein